MKKSGVVKAKQKIFFGDFYDIMESLENIIDEYQEGISVAKRHITGNYMGTEIKIEISQ